MQNPRRIHSAGRTLAALCLGVCAVLGAASAVAQQPKSETKAAQDKSKPKIVILATGGTIAGAQSGSSSYGYQSGAFKIEDLISAVPTMKELANLSGEQVASVGSQDMSDAIWLKLAKRVNEVLKTADVAGIVITHGTDMRVGSRRPATAVGADGPANLYNAVAVAADAKARGRGVLVVINDEIHAARNVEKFNTTNVQTFASPERGPQGLVNSGKIAWFEPMDKRHTTRSEFAVDKLQALPRVDIIYAHANMSPDLIQAAVDNGAKGLVIAGVGDGNMTKEAVALLTKLVKEKNLLVVRSSRLATGLVLRNNEIDDDKMGFVASGEFNPAKSRVLAQLALTKTSDPKRVQEFFNTY
jgi:L-asparaginase